jgi:release factor glutamine methyltransferase
MTLQSALSEAGQRLAGRPDAVLTARLLLQHVLGVTWPWLLAHADDPFPESAETAWHTALARAVAAEPLPYITGRAPFRHLELAVTPATLIPRPETEQLVDLVLAWAGDRQRLRVIDVGTGSGCIAISLATERPGWQVTAIDISADALAVARRNAAEWHAPVCFVQGDLLQPVTESADLIVANLPYVSLAEWRELDDGVKLHEPATALLGGADGLDPVRALLSMATDRLRPGGALFLEIGHAQGAAAMALAAHAFPAARTTCLADWSGHDRFVRIETIPR